MLDDYRRKQMATRDLALAAGKYLEQVITGAAGTLPERWSPVARSAAQWSAQIYLEYTTDQFARAERIVRAALAAEGETSAAWREAMHAWLALALAGQGRHDEAAQSLAQAAAGDPAQRLALLDSLARLAATATPTARQQLATLALQFMARPPTGPAMALSDEQRRRLDLYEAQALVDAGRRDEGLNKLTALAAARPRDADVMERLAQTLLAGSTAADWTAALDKFRLLEQGTATGSERWFRAKLGLAMAHERLGNKSRAAQIVQLTAVLHPELGGADLKAQFDALAARCVAK
jgi:tetratricopeptide (TPR) repeat protein